MWGLYNRRRIYSNFIVCIFAKPWIVSLSCYLVCDTYLRSHRVKYTFIYGVSNFKATNEEALHKDNILLLWTYRKSCIYTSPFSIRELILNISYNIYVITRYLHKSLYSVKAFIKTNMVTWLQISYQMSYLLK